eukprot:1794543-Amphidinium_carterae.1
MPPDSQQLKLGSHVLNAMFTFYACGIQHETTLDMVCFVMKSICMGPSAAIEEAPASGILVHVMASSGRMLVYNVEPSDTVVSLKKQIQEQFGMPPDSQ